MQTYADRVSLSLCFHRSCGQSPNATPFLPQVMLMGQSAGAHLAAMLLLEHSLLEADVCTVWVEIAECPLRSRMTVHCNE